jgi:uncharacterized OB-fold protein
MSGIRRTAADARFSDQVRKRDGWTCKRCSVVYIPPTRALQCAHMFSRKIRATRVDPDNALALCTGCHFEMDTHPWAKEVLFRSVLGDERFDALAARAHGKRNRV